MLKQCRIKKHEQEDFSYLYHVFLYHDGELISEEKYPDGKELDDYLQKLDSEGYVECHTDEQIESAKRVYEAYIKGAIGGAPHWISLGLDENSGLEKFKCSVCGRQQFGRAKYCANCGTPLIHKVL